MIIEWFGLKCLALGFFFGYYLRQRIEVLKKTKCYEIKSFKPNRRIYG